MGTWLYLSTPAIADDELRRTLVLASLVTLGRCAPRRNRMRITLAGTRFTTTVRMVDRVHRGAADGWLDATPTAGAGLAELLQLVFGVAVLTDGGAATDRYLAHLARTQADRRIALLA